MLTIKDLISQVKVWMQSLTRVSMYSYTESDYRKRIYTLKDFYQGNQINYTKEELNRQFSTPGAVSRLGMQTSMINVTRYLTDAVAGTIFNEGISVIANEEREQEIYEEMAESMKLDMFIQTMAKYTWLLNTTFTKVSWRDDEICLDLITPEFVVVEPDTENPYKIKSITYPKLITNVDSSTMRPEGYFYYWSDSQFVVVNEKGVQIAVEGNDGNVNPYNVIPIIVNHAQFVTDGQIIVYPGEELYTSQLNINVMKTELNQLIKYQSFSQPVLINGPKSLLRGNVTIELDPSRLLVLNDSEDGKTKADFKYASPTAQIADVQSALDNEIVRLFSTYGINPSQFIASAQRQSGESMQESNRKLEEQREMYKMVYVYYLEQLFEIARIVWNTHSTQQLSDAGVNFKLHDPSTRYATIADKISDWDWKIKNNLATPVDALVEENDDLTQEDALELLQENIKINAEYQVYVKETNATTTEPLAVEDEMQEMIEEEEKPIEEESQTEENKQLE